MPELKGFCAPSGTVRSPHVSAERTINLYLEESANEKGRYTLLSMPGLRHVALLPSAPIRGLHESSGGRVFAATSTTLYEIFSGWSFLSRGTIPTGSTPISFADNGIHVVFSVEGIGYAFDLAANTLAPLPTTGPQPFGQMAYLDGYLLSNQPGSRRFYYSGLLDALTWPALSFYSAEGQPDLLVTILVDHRELWAFGSQSIEVWSSTGDALNPFARMQNVFLEQGCETPWSVESLDNEVYFLGGSPRGQGPLWKAQGYTPQRVSTHALETAMSTMPTVGDAVTWVARQGGHAFLGLDFPSGGQTWLYDTATQAWSELVALAADGSFLPYPCNTHCPAFAQHLFGDRTTGQLYVWDETYHKYGEGVRLCRRTSPHVRSEQKRLRYQQFRLEAEMGVGLDGGQIPGSDPQMMLSYSDDGGKVWSQGRWRSMGKIGSNRQQLVWYNLGQSRQRAFSVTITDPVKIALLAAYIEVS